MVAHSSNIICRLLAFVVACILMMQAWPSWGYSGYRFAKVSPEFDALAEKLDSLDQTQQLDGRSAPDVAVLQQLSAQSGEALLQARALYWEVKCRQFTMAPDSMITRLERAHALLPEGYDYDKARIAYQLAGNKQRKNELTEAWQLLNEEVLPGFEHARDSIMLGHAYHLLAMIYNDIEELEAATEAIDKAEECFATMHYPQSKVYFFRALLEEGPRSAQLYRMAIREDSTMVVIVSQAYTNLANLYLQREELDSARLSVQLGLESVERYQPENQLLRAFLLVNDALVDVRLANYVDALQTMQQVEALAGDYLGLGNSAQIFRIISDIHENLGHKDEALAYLKKFLQAQDQQTRRVEQTMAQRSVAREEIHAQQQRIEELTREAQRQRTHTIALIVLFLLVIAMITVTLVHYILKRRAREAENSELRSMLQQETVNELLKQNISDQEELTRIEQLLEQKRPLFLAKLKEINPELTANDLRLCTYISIGMRAKEIATLLSVTPDSVNTARYRLRKKLNLQQGDKLDEFLRKL